MKKTILIMLSAILFTTSPAQATIISYSSENSWAAALGGPYWTENFNSDVLNPGLSVFTYAGNISSGLWNDLVILGAHQTSFTFPTAMNGFGGLWDLSPGGYGQGLEFYIGSTLVGSLSAVTNVFQGFISTDPFTTVTIKGGHKIGGAETYTLDNMVYGVDPPAAVPEPGTSVLLAAGLLALTIIGKRRKYAY